MENILVTTVHSIAISLIGKILSNSAQLFDYPSYVIFLKQADGGDACGSGSKACGRVVQGDPSEGEDGDIELTGLA